MIFVQALKQFLIFLIGITITSALVFWATYSPILMMILVVGSPLALLFGLFYSNARLAASASSRKDSFDA